MKIVITPFNSTYLGCAEAGNEITGNYRFFKIWADNMITVNGVTFEAKYRTGESFLHLSASCPSNELELSFERGTSQFLWRLNSIPASEFNIMCEGDSILVDLRKHSWPDLDIKTLRLIKAVLIFNQPKLSDFLALEEDVML